MEHLPKFFLNLRNFQEQSGTTRNTKTLIISTLTISPCSPKYPRIVSYAPHTKGRLMAAFLHVEHVDLVLFCFAKALPPFPLGN